MADATTHARAPTGGRDGSHGVRRRAGDLGAGVRRRGRGGRRAVLQHRDDRLPGSDDRPLLREAGHRLHLPAHRQCRRQRRGCRGGRGACAGLPGARAGDRAEQLPRRARISPAGCAKRGRIGISRRRYAGADPAGARAKGRRRSRSRIARTGEFDLEALQRMAAEWPGLEGMDLAKEVSRLAGRAVDRGEVGLGRGV